MKQQTQTNKIEWREVELGEIADIIRGMSYGNQDVKGEPFDGSIAVLRAGNIQRSRLIYEDFVYIPKNIVDDKQISRKGDILIATSSGSKDIVGKAARMNKNFNATFGAFCCLVRIKTGNSNFLKFYFQSKHYKRFIENSLRGINISNLKISEIRTLKISLPFSNGKPDLKEQERIVSILEKAEKVKTKGDNVGKLLDEYLKSVFNEMFYNKGFDEVELGDEKYFKITMGQSPSGASYNRLGKGMPFFQGKKEFGEKYPSVEQWTTEPSKIAQPKDILLSVRAPVGSINLANIECCIGRGLASISCKKEIKMDFVYSFLKVKEKEIENLGNGSTFKAITSGQLLRIKIPLPSLLLQQKFAKIVEHVERLKENVKKTKQSSEELFNSLMKKAFRGEL